MKRIAAFAAAMAAASLPALADNIAGVETQATGTAVTVDGNNVITAILSAPGTTPDYTYTTYNFLLQDPTGSLMVFKYTPPPGSSYTPSIGDQISISGNYSPYHGVPELGTPYTAVNLVSSGNAVPAPLHVTTAQLQNPTLDNTVLGHLVMLNNVQFSGTSAGDAFAKNTSYTVTDGANNVTVYNWASSYSVDEALVGTPIPTGPVNIEGIISPFTPTGGTTINELVPYAIAPVTSTPEPASLGVFAVGGLLARRRR